jgi:hypothetical protein
MEDGDLRLRGWNPRRGAGHRAGNTSDVNVLTGFEQGAQTSPDDLVIVEGERAERHGR